MFSKISNIHVLVSLTKNFFWSPNAQITSKESTKYAAQYFFNIINKCLDRMNTCTQRGLKNVKVFGQTNRQTQHNMPSLWEHKNHSSVWCTYWLVEPESDCFFAGLNLCNDHWWHQSNSKQYHTKGFARSCFFTWLKIPELKNVQSSKKVSTKAVIWIQQFFKFTIVPACLIQPSMPLILCKTVPKNKTKIRYVFG